MALERSDTFVFQKNDDIGAAAAEDDIDFLTECFIDVGDLAALTDCRNSKRIVLGRTGAGKSALLCAIAKPQRRVIQLSPHSLSLNYIANNNVIQFFEQAGVNLSPFYMLLWKHVFVVELLRAKYNITTEANQKKTIGQLKTLLYGKDHIKEQAVDYLEKWGNKFWLTTDERMRELTERIEGSLSGALKGSALGVGMSAEAGRSLTSEQRTEVVQRGKEAVSAVQIRELENIIQVLADEIFNDPQDRYYLTLDTLDEEWADDRIKYRLIKALIDTIRSFRRLENVKVIAALRLDLLDKVLHSTHDPGFQEEKYESLYLFVRWTRADLERLLHTRLNRLVRRRYTKREVLLDDLLPSRIDNQKPVDYLLDRTFLRPRDAILFLNECIAQAAGKPQLTASVVKHAEEEYSHKRLQSLAYEWQIIFPHLKFTALLLQGMRSSFPLSDITNEFLETRFQDILPNLEAIQSDPNTRLLDALFTEGGNFPSIRNTVIRNLHLVGLVGIKTSATSSTDWSYESRLSLAPGELRPSSIISIHPMFYRALSIRT